MNQYAGMGNSNQSGQNRYMPNVPPMTSNIPPMNGMPGMHGPQGMMNMPINMQNAQNLPAGGNLQNMRGYQNFMPPYMANQQSINYLYSVYPMGYYYQMPGYQQQNPSQHHGKMGMNIQSMQNNPYINTRMQPQGHHPMQQQQQPR
jgi:hypothetical protein